MTVRQTGWLTWIVLAAVALAGCGNDNDEPAVVLRETLTLSVVLEADTMQTRSGIVSHINGYVKLASDWRPQGIPGYKIAITLGQSWVSLRYLNEELTNRTDEQGRIPFFLRDQLRRVSHYSTVHASWGGLAAADSIWIEVVNE